MLVYLAAKQPLLAVAESHVLSRKGAGEHRFAQEIYDAQQHAGVLAREAFEMKEKAQGTGLDAATTSAVVGDVAPLDFQSGVFSHPQITRLQSDPIVREVR